MLEGAGGLSFAADGYTGFARLGLSRLTFGISLFPCSNLDGQVGGLEDGGDGDMWHCICSLLILWAVVAWNKAYIRRTRPSWVLSNFRRGAVARLAMAPRGRYTTQPALWRCLVLPDGRRTRRRLYPVPGGDESRPWDMTRAVPGIRAQGCRQGSKRLGATRRLRQGLNKPLVSGDAAGGTEGEAGISPMPRGVRDQAT